MDVEDEVGSVEGSSEEEDDSGVESGSSEEEEEELEPRVLPARSTRGNRMTDMHGEGDDEFWAQSFWQEDEHDEAYSTEEEERDVLDDDFFDKEQPEETEEVQVEKEKIVKRNAYVDPALKSQSSKRAAGAPRPKREALVVPATRKLRESTRQRTEDRVEKEKMELEEAQARPKKQATVQRELTQEEKLAEAKLTEQQNIASLQELLRLEEERKRKARQTKRVAVPMIRFLSTKEHNLVSFSLTDKFPDYLYGSPVPPPKRPKCSVTGQPAKYHDPLTGEYFASVDAFRALRQRTASASSS